MENTLDEGSGGTSRFSGGTARFSGGTARISDGTARFNGGTARFNSRPARLTDRFARMGLTGKFLFSTRGSVESYKGSVFFKPTLFLN